MNNIRRPHDNFNKDYAFSYSTVFFHIACASSQQKKPILLSSQVEALLGESGLRTTLTHPKVYAIRAKNASEVAPIHQPQTKKQHVVQRPRTQEEQIMALYEENRRKAQVIQKIQQGRNLGVQLPRRTTQQRQRRASSRTQPAIVRPIPQRPSTPPFAISFLKDQPH